MPTPTPCPHRASRHGFTLVELMIALAVMAILAALAWPSLQDAVRKSRRADAMAGLMNMMQAQERYRGSNPTYQGTLSGLHGATATTSPDSHYDLSIVDGSATATQYTLRATARSAGRQAGDSRCQVFQVEMTTGRITYSSLASGGAANAAPDPCWVR